MNSKERKRLDVLRRRATHLTYLIDNWVRGDKDRTAAERGALRWAIRVVEAASEELLEQVRQEALKDDDQTREAQA